MSEKSKGSLEKIILAGIGALAATAEKSKEMLEELINKGELTVEQGKELNEELTHTIKSKFHDKVEKPAKDFAVTNVVNSLDKLSPENIEQIKAKIIELESKKEEDKKCECDSSEKECCMEGNN